jgi:TolA-binding protein
LSSFCPANQGVSHKLSDQIITLENKLKDSQEQVVGLTEQLSAMRMLTSGNDGSESPLSRLETLQRQFRRLQEEGAARAEENKKLSAELDASRKAVRSLRSDVTREHNLLRLVEDILPGKSSLCGQKLERFSMVLSKQQVRKRSSRSELCIYQNHIGE